MNGLKAVLDALSPLIEIFLDWLTTQIEKPQPGEYVEDGAGDGGDIHDLEEGVPI